VPQLKISRLREWGYLKKDNWFNASITWNCNLGWRPQVEIGLIVSILDEPHIILNYQYKGEKIRYRVDLVSVPSNLGKGVLWYFVCPKTGKRCRVLHLVGKYFYHRTAFENVCYWSETFSNKNKGKYKDLLKFNKREKAFDILYSKNFKSHYNGKPTKRYVELLKWIEDAEGLSEEEIFYG
jgi:hypothetical protein